MYEINFNFAWSNETTIYISQVSSQLHKVVYIQMLVKYSENSGSYKWYSELHISVTSKKNNDNKLFWKNCHFPHKSQNNYTGFHKSYECSWMISIPRIYCIELHFINHIILCYINKSLWVIFYQRVTFGKYLKCISKSSLCHR